MAVFLGAIKKDYRKYLADGDGKYSLEIFATKNKVSGGGFYSISDAEKFLKGYMENEVTDQVRTTAVIYTKNNHRFVKKGRTKTYVWDTEIIKTIDLKKYK